MKNAPIQMDSSSKDDEPNSGFLPIDACNIEENASADEAPQNNNRSCNLQGWFQGHSFVKKIFHKPATCHHCSELLWGILGTNGMICEICNFLAHEKCIRLVVSPCTCIVPFLVQDPVSHCWSDIGHFKRKFCNVCRKRLEDLLAVRCEVCEYYAHYECLDFVSADCKQCAVSTPGYESKVDPTRIYPQEFVKRSVAPSTSSFSYRDDCGKPRWQQVPSSTADSAFIPTGSGGTPSSDSEQPASSWPAEEKTKNLLARTVIQDTFKSSNVSLTSVSRSSKIPIVGDAPSPPPQAPSADYQLHHWREGNLPVQSKCAVCRKSCWSVECLSGMRCEWCGTTAHYACYKGISLQCDFGPLRDIMLPPCAVSLPRTSVLMEHIIGMMKPQAENTTEQQGMTDEFSSSGDSPEESGFERKSIRDKADRDFDDYVRVYDGTARYRKRQCRYLSLGKSVSVRKVIELSLKAFQLPPDEVKDFCLVEINEKDGSERKLESNTFFKSQLTFETRRPQIILRYRERQTDRHFINVYPGSLMQYGDCNVTSIQVPITRDSTANDVLISALKTFGLQQANWDKYHLVETVLDRGLSERVIPCEERPWDIIERLKRDSVRAVRLTRFYVRPVEDPHGPGIALFIGNLKKGLSQRLYEKILLDRLGPENKWDSIDVIYYDFGSLVVLYSDAEKADEAYNILKNSVFEERQILAMILPRVQAVRIPTGVNPLLVFVNVKSGGCQGIELITSFRKLLNPHQVFNLDYGGPLPGLHCFRHLNKFKILVCGGDGTVGWALSCLDNVGQDAACPTPPMAILPLGTGNDLARVLRWGPGYTGAEEPMQLLWDVVEAEEIRLDRWTVVIKPNEVEKDAHKKQMQLEANAANTNEDTSRIFVMNNYFGIGIDADLNLDFHMAREENPAKFNSRIHNKSVYFKMGLRKMVNRTKCKDLHQNIVVEVDGRQIDLPPLEGIIILNILSWGAGANPWGVEKDDSFNRPTHYDGQLEVVGVTGVVHMGQIFSGLRTGTRLAQGGHIRITLKSDIPVQVDGEPWVQSPGQIIVLRSALKATMLKKRKRKVNRRHTEPGLGGVPVSSGASLSSSSHCQPVSSVALPNPNVIYSEHQSTQSVRSIPKHESRSTNSRTSQNPVAPMATMCIANNALGQKPVQAVSSTPPLSGLVISHQCSHLPTGLVSATSGSPNSAATAKHKKKKKKKPTARKGSSSSNIRRPPYPPDSWSGDSDEEDSDQNYRFRGSEISRDIEGRNRNIDDDDSDTNNALHYSTGVRPLSNKTEAPSNFEDEHFDENFGP